ncbi:MAG: type I methionyl aminopeptidase [Gemmataceae bacterium]|nr:type I methionyl aminopeptidase [Gemmataceae bacterium]
MLRSLFQRGPELKSQRELGLMREAGKIVAEALRLCRDLARPGVRTIDLDRAVEALYAKYRAQPLFKGYRVEGIKVPFPSVTCISINEQVVHGIPSQREIRDGDLVKIDTACKLNGWCADAAITLMIGNVRPERRRLVEVAHQVLQIAIQEMPRRRWWSEVALLMQRHATTHGFSVVEQYVGHGIGRVMHESPQVPNYVNREMKKFDFRLEPGLVLAVEPMLNMGRKDTRVLADHWTVVTQDGLPSAHVEHTLALTSDGVEILTRDGDSAPEAPVPTATEQPAADPSAAESAAQRPASPQNTRGLLAGSDS